MSAVGKIDQEIRKLQCELRRLGTRFLDGVEGVTDEDIKFEARLIEIIQKAEKEFEKYRAGNHPTLLKEELAPLKNACKDLHDMTIDITHEAANLSPRGCRLLAIESQTFQTEFIHKLRMLMTKIAGYDTWEKIVADTAGYITLNYWFMDEFINFKED